MTTTIQIWATKTHFHAMLYISEATVEIDVVVVAIAIVDIVIAHSVVDFVYVRIIISSIHMVAITRTLAFVIPFGFPIFNWWRLRVLPSAYISTNI